MSSHHIVVVALGTVSPLDLAIPTQIFGPRSETPYTLSVCAPTDEVATTAGYRVVVDGGLELIRSADTVIVAGLDPPFTMPAAGVVDALRDADRRGIRIASICTGAFALAAAGILDGRRATTHWLYADDLRRAYPAVTVDPNVLYVDEGRVLTSAGVCCAIDLCLHIVRRDLGAAVANQIARLIVASPHREGGQTQFVPSPVATESDSSLSATRAWAIARIDQPLSVDDLARHAGTATRSFLRQFSAETGTTPLRWLNHERFSVARELLETTELSIDEVARASGLGSATNLRLHFRRTLDTSPTQYRQMFTRNITAGPGSSVSTLRRRQSRES